MKAAAAKPDPFASDEDWLAADIALPGANSDYRVATVKAVDTLKLYVEHRDGVSGYVRFEPSALRGAFAELNNADFFRAARVENGAVVWSDDLDIAPDNMHRHLFAFGEWVLQ